MRVFDHFMRKKPKKWGSPEFPTLQPARNEVWAGDPRCPAKRLTANAGRLSEGFFLGVLRHPGRVNFSRGPGRTAWATASAIMESEEAILSCALCHTRKEKRFCPAIHDRICAVCCGKEREVTLDCPSECPYLQQARRHEKPRRLEISTKPRFFPTWSGERNFFTNRSRWWGA